MEKCNCNPVCDDCKCSEKIDISTPHFENRIVEELTHIEEDVSILTDKVIGGFIISEDDAENIDLINDLGDNPGIDPDGGHKQIQAYKSIDTAFAFANPTPTDELTKLTDSEAKFEFECNCGDDISRQYEKIANRRFSDYIVSEFDTFEPAYFYYIQNRLREITSSIQPNKEILYSLRNTLDYVEQILSIEPTPEVEMQILLRFRINRTQLIRRRDCIVTEINTAEATIADLFNDKADIEILLSEGHFAEIASRYESEFQTPPPNANDLIFAVRYVEGMSIGVVIDKSGNKLFTKVDFIAPFNKYDELVAFRRLFADYSFRLSNNQTKETNNGR